MDLRSCEMPSLDVANLRPFKRVTCTPRILAFVQDAARLNDLQVTAAQLWLHQD